MLKKCKLIYEKVPELKDKKWKEFCIGEIFELKKENVLMLQFLIMEKYHMLVLPIEIMVYWNLSMLQIKCYQMKIV